MSHEDSNDSLKQLKEITHSLGKLHAEASNYINGTEDKTGIGYVHLSLDDQVRQIRAALNKIISLVDHIAKEN